jgi:hypothetical protein
MASNSQPPVRNPSGATTDQPFGPFADCGNGNPAFYHQFFDDFDESFGAAGTTNLWVVTPTPGTSVVHTPGDGGIAVFTTGTGAGSIAQIQLPSASYTTVAGQKHFFECRIQLTNINTSAWVAGLTTTNTNPFSGFITDGIYFSKAANQTGINLIVMHGSVVSATVAIPTAAIAQYVNGAYFDLAWYLNRKGEILIFASSQLVGFIPQSGTGSTSPPTNNTGACARVTPAPTLPTVPVNVTLALSNGTQTAPTTMYADFICVSKER